MQATSNVSSSGSLNETALPTSTVPGRTHTDAGFPGSLLRSCRRLPLCRCGSQLRETRPADPVTRLVVNLPEDRRLTGAAESFANPIALSPDGRHLVYSAMQDHLLQLYVRDMDRFDERPIPGTAGGTSPFFSPDGAWVGFYANGTLQKVPLAGGLPVTICEVPAFRGTGNPLGHER